MSLFQFCIKHFKTISFFTGFITDILILPKTTSPYYIWIGPINIAIILIFVFTRQAIQGNLVKRTKKIKKEVKVSQETEEKKTFEDLKTKGYLRIEKATRWATFCVSFFLGTLLSNTLVYYFRSSDIIQMWPIFLIIIIAIILNEFVYGRVPDLILFYIGLTFYIIFNIPILINKVNTYTFFVSILVAVIFTSILTVLLQRIYLSRKDFIFLMIFSAFFPFLMLRLYYINYIPAVPLALGDSGFYSKVEKVDLEVGYTYNKEDKGLVQNKKFFILNKDHYDLLTLKDINGGVMYFYSSIISPANVSADITHVWEKYDTERKIWIKEAEIEYPISGGREDGYRGYSQIANISQGEWRVRVLADDRLVGLKKIMIY